MSNSTSQKTVPRKELIKIYRQAVKFGVPIESLNQKVDRLMARQHSNVFGEADLDAARHQRWRAQIPLIINVFAIIIPTIFLGVGFFMLSTAVLPIVSHLAFASPELNDSKLQAPIPREEVIDIVPAVIAQSSVTGGNAPAIEPTILDIELDYTNLSNWFESPVPELQDIDENFIPLDENGVPINQASTYYIDIPKIDIERAEVKVGGTDLNGSLIHYPGTADPGQLGAPVIFGHSVLRQFYNPSIKNKNRYNSIFSYIMTLEPGDEIFVTHDGVKYTYRVREKTEVKPEDVYILQQQRTAKNLKLVTCTPEGTYLRRGIVTATLVE